MNLLYALSILRVTPIEEIERFAERFTSAYPKIQSRLDFDTAFDDYMEVMTPKQDTTLREKAWSKVRTDKGLPKGERTERKERTKQRKKKEFTRIGKVKTKIVRARHDIVSIKGHKVIKYRDRLGRFVKVEKRK